jgi:hypothetical protein
MKRNDTRGMATRFTASPTSDIVPKTAKHAGARANITASWSLIAEITRWPGEGHFRDGSAQIIRTPTAMNDNQNPADSGATGSWRSTSNRASDQSRPGPTWRLASRAITYTDSMSKVRCVGIEKPASHA